MAYVGFKFGGAFHGHGSDCVPACPKKAFETGEPADTSLLIHSDSDCVVHIHGMTAKVPLRGRRNIVAR